MIQKSKTSNLMAPPLLGPSSRSDYQAIPPVDRTSSKALTVEEAAAAVRERLPGRSRKAKDQFRRQMKGERNDQAWRGRLTCYSPFTSFDIEKLNKHLKELNDHNAFYSSVLYTRKWRVKVHFDVLHLNSINEPSHSEPQLPEPSDFNPTPTTSSTAKNNNSSAVLDYLSTYDTEMSDMETSRRKDDEQDKIHGNKAGDSPLSPSTRRRNSTHLLPEQNLDGTPPSLDVFIFGFGPIVFWGFANSGMEKDMLKDLTSFVDGELHDPVAAESAKEEMEFSYKASDNDLNSVLELGVVNDLIELTHSAFSGSGGRSKPAAEKLAISSALAQSCHLSIYESRLGETIGRYSHIPKQLAETGTIDITAHEISKEIGRLFVERNLINLEPELLDTPEFLWNDNEFEPVYKNVYRYLEVEPRIEVLNKRLTIVGELLDVLRQQQEHMHANKLEWIVVILIACEVMLQVVWNILLKDVLGWVGQPGNEY